MLRIVGSRGTDCTGVTRRSFLQAGILGLGGFTLSDLFRAQSAQAAPSKKKNNVILMWMSGGPGHMETWDPKPDAVDQYRGPFGAIPTSLPGIQFGELCPEEAKIADR